MTLPVAVGTVKYKKVSLKELKAIWPYIQIELKDIIESGEHILPSLGGALDKYSYVDAVTAETSAARYYQDGVLSKEPYLVKNYMGWLRRLFIVSGVVEDDREMLKLILNMKHKAAYLRRNKDEI